MSKRVNGKQFLSDLKLYSDFLKWDDNLGRYETWNEGVDKVLNTHTLKYGDKIDLYLDEIRPSFYKKEFLSSQRNLQYRGDQILKHNARLYNCCTTYAYSPDVFNKGFYVLLCGAGLGVSLRKKFVSQLPEIIKKENPESVIHVVDDSIEGWAESSKALISSYCKHPSLDESYFGKNIIYDFSKIRPKGAFISGGFRAPGPDGLRQSLARIDALLAANTGPFKSIVAYDVFMHLSDAVLSGGVRRCLAKGSKVLVENGTYKNIEEVVVGDHVKTLNGYKKVTNTFIQGKQPTLIISHQSGELICTQNHKVAVFEKSAIIWKNAGELTLKDNLVFCTNRPVFSRKTKLPEFNYVKPRHSTTCKDIVIPEFTKDIAYLIGLVQGDGYVRLTTRSGSVDIAIEGNNYQKALFIMELLRKFRVNPSIIYPSEKDNCYKVRVKSKQLATYFFEHIKQPKAVLKIPKFILTASSDIKAAYISGVFCADGSFKTRPAVIVSSIYKPFLQELQALVAEFGIHSNIKDSTFKSRKSHWKNIYELTVRGINNFNNFRDLLIFTPKKEDRGYIKYDRTNTILDSIGNIQPIKISQISYGPVVETFDIEVEDEHSFMCEGVLVHNSAMNVVVDHDDIDMIYAKTGDWYSKTPWRGRSNNSVGLIRDTFSKEQFNKLVELNQGTSDIGFVFTNSEDEIFNPCFEINFSFYNQVKDKNQAAFQLCNLNEINASATVDSKGNFSEETFYRQCRNAAILGTLQAGYTSFPYLGKQTEDIVAGEALLGVSITGWMSRPELFNPDILQRGARIVLDTNDEVANYIGINLSARTTTVKPSGNASVILQTSSGIHPEHSLRYFRIMQLNKDSEVAKYLEEHQPDCIEESKWSATNSDYVVYVPCENQEGVITKAEMQGIKHLELIKLVQHNWVLPGTRVGQCFEPETRHNVSNTVIIDDLPSIVDYLYQNQKEFTAVSFISPMGDKDYVQAPFTSVLDTEKLVASYGDAVIFMAGLIVDGLHYFHDDLWTAVSYVKDDTKPLVGTRAQVMLQKDWIRRVKKFSKNYFKGDLDTTLYCMKDVHLWHKWNVVVRNFKPVDFVEILTKPNYADVSDYAAISCHGGSCEL